MAKRLQVSRLQVIFKTVERCNLACPYCYYFEGGDQSFRERPARTSLKVAERLVNFIDQAIEDVGLQHVQIVFHGGEPTLQKIEDFEASCAMFVSGLAHKCLLDLSIQTNGVRLNEDWIAALKRNGVQLGVSIDGPAHVHDPARPHHNGKGSLAGIARNLHRIRHEDPEYYRNSVASLTVLNAKHDYGAITDFFSHDLGFRKQNFLLPDCTHDDGIPDGATASDYGRALCTIFDRWVKDRTWSVREIDEVLRRFQRAKLKDGVTLPDRNGDEIRWVYNHIVVIQSDGSLKIDDSYIPASDWRDKAPVSSIFHCEMKDYLKHEIFDEMFSLIENSPSQCASCKWENICHGGDLENRWSTKRGFDNPSVFCDGLQMFYEHVTAYLVNHGYPQEYIDQRLKGDYDFVTAGYAA